MCRGTLRMRSSTAALVMPCSRRRWTKRSRVRAEVMPIPARRRSAIQAIQPAGERGKHRMAREIDLQRSHRDIAVRHGVEVGSGAAFLLGARGSYPVDRTSARILGAHHRLGAVTVAESAGAEATQLRE